MRAVWLVCLCTFACSFVPPDTFSGSADLPPEVPVGPLDGGLAHDAGTIGGADPSDSGAPLDGGDSINGGGPLDAGDIEVLPPPPPPVPDGGVGAPAVCPGVPRAASFCAGSELCYRFEDLEPGGRRVLDESPFQRHGEVDDAELLGSVVGAGISLGGGSAVEVDNGQPLTLENGFTVQAWGWLERLPGRGRATLFDLDDQANVSVSSKGEIWCHWSEQDVTSAPGVIRASTWTHIACTADAASLKLYVNGIRVSQAPITSEPDVTPGAPLVGGNRGSGGGYWNGLIDELRVLPQPLTDAEICWAARL